MDCLVSVIVPVHNTVEYLPRCIDSIRNQSLKDIEIILVENQSNDGSAALCDEYMSFDSRVKVLHLPVANASIARNAGLYINLQYFSASLRDNVYLICRFHGTCQSCGKFNISCLRCLDDDGRVRNGLDRLFFFRKSCEHQDSKCADAYKSDYDLTCFLHGSSSFSATCCFLISPADSFLSSGPHVLFRGQLFYSLPLLLFPAV